MGADASEATVDLTLPSDPRYLALVRVIVGATAAAIPSLSESRVADLELVATELFANAMEANWRSARIARNQTAPSAPRPSERSGMSDHDLEVAAPVHVMCHADALQVTLTVVDSGPGLEVLGDPHPPVRDLNRLHHERGLGIPLIQYLADRVDYVSDDDGTRATVVLSDRVVNPPSC